MRLRAQSAVEFLSTYSFSFLLISIVITILLLFSSLPRTVLPTQCSFYNGFYCSDVAYFNRGTGSELVVLLTDVEPGIVNISNFSANVNYHNSINGFCYPQRASPGQDVYCVANFTGKSNVNNEYQLFFSMSADYCAKAPPNVSSYSVSCISSNTFSYGGEAQVEGTLYNPADLPPIQNVYCVGGTSFSSTAVYYAPITQNGLGEWYSTNSYPISLTSTSCTIYKNYIYCPGGGSGFFSSGYSYYAPLSQNGVLGWSLTTKYPTSLSNAGCTSYKGYIYCVGGSGSASEELSYYAPISTIGIGNWILTTNYPLQFTGSGCYAYEGYIFCFGTTSFSASTQNAVYYAPVSNNGIGNWISTAPYPLQAFGTAGCTIYEGYVYCVGSDTFFNQQTVYYAPISNLGVGAWIATNSYPVGVGTGGCVVADGYLYCNGGNSGFENQVYYAPILSQGVGNWLSGNTYPLGFGSGYCSVPGYTGGYLGGGAQDV